LPTVDECATHIRWLQDHGRGHESCVVYLPKVEAQRRRENKEKTHWIKAKVSLEAKKEWETQRDRYIGLVKNKEVAYSIMFEILSLISDEAITARAEESQPY
jgi:hypothetical protein